MWRTPACVVLSGQEVRRREEGGRKISEPDITVMCVCVWESYACTYILYLHRQRQTYNRLTLECRTDHFTLEQRHNSVFICSYSDGDLTLIYPDGSRCSSGFLRMTIINFECNKSACKTQTCPKKIICLDIYSFLLTLALLYF